MARDAGAEPVGMPILKPVRNPKGKRTTAADIDEEYDKLLESQRQNNPASCKYNTRAVEARNNS